MMNKLRTARLHLVKFLFILPLLAVLLVAFRDVHRQRSATSQTAFAHSADTSRPGDKEVLYVVDGKQMPPGWTTAAISLDSISSIEVLKDKEATQLFGPSGAGGVIAITTKAYAKPDGTDAPGEDSLATGLIVKGTRPVLYIAEGRKLTPEEIRKMNVRDIEQIIVHKNDNVTRLFGAEGRNGVVVIVFKKQ
jgi:TonB-dependent SusC/RagA subfamily outer membrane receptor